MSRKTKMIFFASVLLVASFIHYFFFEIRYVWYKQPDDYEFLRRGHAVFLIVMVLMIMFYPSKILALLIVPPSLLFPPFFRPEVFVPVDLAMLIVTAVITLAFVLLVIWRQRF
jgi:hypothetical protein